MLYVCMQVFLLTVWNFELYMLPLMLLFLFVKNLLFLRVGDSLMRDDNAADVRSIRLNNLFATTIVHLTNV